LRQRRGRNYWVTVDPELSRTPEPHHRELDEQGVGSERDDVWVPWGSSLFWARLCQFPVAIRLRAELQSDDTVAAGSVHRGGCRTVASRGVSNGPWPSPSRSAGSPTLRTPPRSVRL